MSARGDIGRGLLIASLVLVYAGLAFYFHLHEHRHTVYIHAAYLPIVMAAIWWGYWGLAVAGLEAVLLLGLRVAGIGIEDPASDAVRVASMVAVAVLVATLSERLRTARHASEVSRESYRSLFEKSLSGIWLYRDERVILVNERLARMLRFAPDDLIGRSIWSLVHPDDREDVMEQLRKRASGESPDLHYECRLERADGTWLWVDQASSPTQYDGAPAVIVNSYDITERKEAVTKRAELSELARQQEDQLIHSTRLAELGEMAAAVAHELNQPLTGIRTFANNAIYMLDNQAGEPGEVRANLQRISDQVDRTARIIGQMRQLARRSERQLGRVDLNAVVTEALEFLRSQMQLAGVHVEARLAPQLPVLLGDRTRLEQVFLNLLTNARQAMESTPERVLQVETRLEAPEGPVVVSITDTGGGFAPETAKRIFAPFFTTKKPGHGTGLGLSISLNIIKDHGGTITADSEPERGTTFHVKLPVRPPGVSDVAEEAADET